MISNAALLLELDGYAAAYRSTDDTARYNRIVQYALTMVGDAGVSGDYPGCGDLAFIQAMAPAYSTAATTALPANLSDTIFDGIFQDLNGYLQAQGKTVLVGSPAAPAFTDLSSFLAYQNSLTPFAMLVDPRLATEWFQFNDLKPLMLLPAGVVFAPATVFGTATVGGGGAGSIAYTNTGSIPTANSGTQQGYTPALNLQALVTTPINGTLTITVTGSGVSSTGAAITGHTWTGTLSNDGDGPYALTPTNAGDRISSISAVTGAGSATAGAFTLQTAVDRVVS